MKRIVDSRKNAHGRVTRLQSRQEDANRNQNTGGTEDSNRDPQNTQQTGTTETVILELIDTDKNGPNHPCQMGKLLRGKGFSAYTDIVKIGKFRFKIVTNEISRLRKLKLETDNLRIYEPKNNNQTIVFVKGVPESFDEDEMVENIETDFPVLKVQRIRRMGRNNELQDTSNIKVTVEGGQVPDKVRIYGCYFRAELYIFPVRQCKNCWRYGHGAKHCTSRTRCASCGGCHDVSVCSKDTKSPNCKRGHKADDPGCPERQRHKSIRLAMRESKSLSNKRRPTTPDWKTDSAC
ncbi:uncharacterized protein LOC134227967 [Armigeres subalbatus]|uniref:uncharacterized protein LOC134227967 n=1 Tax=Armigeres subalbatus TaxID=124917 RepID=UPI002ED3B4DC